MIHSCVLTEDNWGTHLQHFFRSGASVSVWILWNCCILSWNCPVLFWSLSLPVLTLIFPALLPCLVRDSLCTALQTKILWINWSLNAIDTIETWVSGNLTALTERSQPAIRWRVGEVANRVSCGSFRGGHWYLPIRNHDNRYFADWIRLCPGLSKNSENGNSCPKPHKAARMIEAVGRAVSIETETIIAIWILPRRRSRLYKGKLIKMETKMVKMDRE